MAAPPFLAPVRTLEVLAVRTFLDVDAADLPEPAGRPTAATRWRGAAWYALHLTLGAAVTLGLLVAVPVATQLVLSAVGGDRAFLAPVAPLLTSNPVGWVALAVVLLLALPYLVTGARRLLCQAAVPLLGPDQTARIAELEARADRLAERGRLARELHDSVGHALTVTTLQAAAAARQLETDPDAARRSLAAIEDTGRAAMADLDHVLGLLRGPDAAAGHASRAPARALADVPRLVDDARRAGADVRLDADPAVLAESSSAGVPGFIGVPRAVGHEAFRVAQEAVTNAVRHAPGRPVRVRVAVERPRTLVVEVTNPLADGRNTVLEPVETVPVVSTGSIGEGLVSTGSTGGRGLRGMAERVRLLRGELDAGRGNEGGADVWRVRARFRLP